jgi:hypothetical protein
MELDITIRVILRKDLEDRVHGGDITLQRAAWLQLNEKKQCVVVGVKEV